MTNKLSYRDCYNILRLRHKCDWGTLKKAHRKQLQKWHPDKFSSQDDYKSYASDKFKEINEAFNILAAYHEETGELPSYEINDSTNPVAEFSSDRNDEHEEENESNASVDFGYVPESKIQYNYKLILTGIALGLYLVYFGFDTSSIEDTPKQHQESSIKPLLSDKQGTDMSNTENITDKPDDSQISSIALPSFSYGSSISEVISVQGVPTKIEGDVWYYGKSEVHFKEGKVVSWVRSQDNPLNVRI